MKTHGLYQITVALIIATSFAIISCAKKNSNSRIEGTHQERQSDGTQGSPTQGLTPETKAQVVDNRTQLDDCLKQSAAQLYETQKFVECTYVGFLASTQIASATGQTQLSEGLKKLNDSNWKATEVIATRLALIKEIMAYRESIDKNSLYLLLESVSLKVFNVENVSVETGPEKISEGTSALEKIKFLAENDFEKQLKQSLADLKSNDQDLVKKTKESLAESMKSWIAEETEVQKNLVEKTNEVVKGQKQNLSAEEKAELKIQLTEVGYQLKFKGMTEKIIQGSTQLLAIFDKIQKISSEALK